MATGFYNPEVNNRVEGPAWSFILCSLGTKLYHRTEFCQTHLSITLTVHGFRGPKFVCFKLRACKMRWIALLAEEL